MTLEEYRWLIEAFELKRVDQERDMHWMAFLGHMVKAERQVGKSVKPVYKSFNQFFDYDKHLESIKDKTSKKKSGSSMLSRIDEYRRKGR